MLFDEDRFPKFLLYFFRTGILVRVCQDVWHGKEARCEIWPIDRRLLLYGGAWCWRCKDMQSMSDVIRASVNQESRVFICGVLCLVGRSWWWWYGSRLNSCCGCGRWDVDRAIKASMADCCSSRDPSPSSVSLRPTSPNHHVRPSLAFFITTKPQLFPLFPDRHK